MTIITHPIKIDDLKDFQQLALQKYADATNKYLTVHKDLSTKRSVESLVEINGVLCFVLNNGKIDYLKQAVFLAKRVKQAFEFTSTSVVLPMIQQMRIKRFLTM